MKAAEEGLQVSSAHRARRAATLPAGCPQASSCRASSCGGVGGRWTRRSARRISGTPSTWPSSARTSPPRRRFRTHSRFDPDPVPTSSNLRICATLSRRPCWNAYSSERAGCSSHTAPQTAHNCRCPAAPLPPLPPLPPAARQVREEAEIAAKINPTDSTTQVCCQCALSTRADQPNPIYHLALTHFPHSIPLAQSWWQRSRCITHRPRAGWTNPFQPRRTEPHGPHRSTSSAGSATASPAWAGSSARQPPRSSPPRPSPRTTRPWPFSSR